MTKAFYITAAELAQKGKDNIPDELLSAKHLIYSSPATLAFNSPGAQGFGVKRAGLAVPNSVMLLVAPACCGRNTTMLSAESGYGDRFSTCFLTIPISSQAGTLQRYRKPWRRYVKALITLPRR